MNSFNNGSVSKVATHINRKFYLVGLAALMCVVLPLGYSFAASRISNSFNNIIAPNVVLEPMPQEQFKGQWNAEMKKGLTDKIWFSISHRSEGGGFSQSSTLSKFDTLRGLTMDQINSANSTNVRFEIVRDAGTISCEGIFKGGSGAGFFTFTQNQSYVSDMAKRGYENLEAKKVFQLAMSDLSLKYIDEIKTAGYASLPLDDLCAFRIHGVTPEFISEMKKSFGKLDADDLIAAQVHRITPEYASQMTALIGGKLTLDDLVSLRVHRITPELIKSFESLGFTKLDADELVSIKVHKLTQQYVQEMQNAGFGKLSLDDILELKIHGITLEFIKKAKDKGLTDLTIDQVVQLKNLRIISDK